MDGRSRWTRIVGRLRRPFRGFLLVLSGCVIYFLSCAGCAWTVHPPDPQTSMAPVVLSQYGWHTRLALPGPDGSSFIEYGFGDWRYYALEERSLASGLRALFFSDTATLSRRPLAPPRDGEWGRRLGSRRSVELAAPAVKVGPCARNWSSCGANRTPTRWKRMDCISAGSISIIACSTIPTTGRPPGSNASAARSKARP